MSLIFTASSQNEYDEGGDLISGSTELGLERPYHYRNNLKNTLIIPRHSKVAVQSIEFDRKPVYQLTNDDHLEWYLGDILNTGTDSTSKSMGECVSSGMPIFLADSEGALAKPGDYTRQQFAAHLQKQLKAWILNPNYWDTATCVKDNANDPQKLLFGITSLATVDISDAAGNEGLGIPGIGDAGDEGNGVKIKSWFQPTLDPDEGDPGQDKFSVISKGDKITRQTATTADGTVNNRQWSVEECSPICRSYPVSQKNGQVTFAFADPNTDVAQWDIGFTRAVTHDADYYDGWMKRVTPPVIPVTGAPYEREQLPVMDFMVSYRYDPAAVDGAFAAQQIRCYQLKWDPTANNYIQEEIRYWTGAAPYQGYGAAATGPAAIVTKAMMNGAAPIGTARRKIRFTFTGECIKVELLNAAGGDPFVLCDSGGVGAQAGGVWKSIDQNQWGLYPRINWPDAATVMDIDKYDTCITENQRNFSHNAGVNSWNYPMDPNDHLQTLETINNYLPGCCWWSNRYEQGELNVATNWVPPNTEIEDKQDLINIRTFNNPQWTHAATVTDSPWTKLDTGNENPNYISVILGNKTNTVSEGQANLTQAQLAPDLDEYKRVRGVYACDNSNMGRAIGFGSGNPRMAGASALGTRSDRAGLNVGSTFYAKWSIASQEAVTIISKTLLVACPTLTHQSYNFCINAPSKFLYHCPRITTSGLSAGRMFFEPSEKTYVKLNNPEPLYLQDLEIMLTDKNGRPATDLQGSTSVCLHIDQC
tara:strand:+ start:609 stop:2888 length:2280 start_codon:yes stop_codon:yes gene_type:complete